MSRRQAVWTVAGMAAASLLIIVVASVVISATMSARIRDTQVTNTGTLKATERTLAIVEDCTTPGSECFQEGQRRTAAAIADINRVTVYAAACADRPGVQGQSEIYACVVESLAEDDESGG